MEKLFIVTKFESKVIRTKWLKRKIYVSLKKKRKIDNQFGNYWLGFLNNIDILFLCFLKIVIDEVKMMDHVDTIM